MGPMAQDFYAAFKIGEDDRHITTIDEDGVALSAVKALYRRSVAADRRSAVAESENRRLRGQLQSVQQRLDELASEVAALRRR